MKINPYWWFSSQNTYTFIMILIMYFLLQKASQMSTCMLNTYIEPCLDSDVMVFLVLNVGCSIQVLH